ncbi:hypothetical protein IFM89_008375 [Coptis chinensis]|uniref:Phosphoinositide phospholipase C n=1 Tax=Coptis chinensis TaxID=261450 RepID=A0A835INA5_9MAGN|nr:hypothetical protein IFM89_008375 [Coptis chinensis]
MKVLLLTVLLLRVSSAEKHVLLLKYQKNEIMSKIEEAAKPLGFNVHKNNYKMKLKGDKTGRNGHLSVATEVSVTIDGCQEKILSFSGRPGLYIEGSVSPPISSVDIRVVTVDNSGDAPLQKGELVLETTIEPDGFFIGGRLYDDADYDIEASKLGYHLKSIGSSSFSRQKLSQIAIRIYPGEESSANGGCGYVKMPEFLHKVGPHNEIFDPRASLPVKKIFKVGIAGVPTDSVMKKTKTVEDNWTPVWNEEFEFPLTTPSLLCFRLRFMSMTCLKRMILEAKHVCRRS